MLPSPAREILGFITLCAIIWDTALTFVLLTTAKRNRSRIVVLEQWQSSFNEKKRSRNMTLADWVSIIQTGCAVLGAAFTTYLFIKNNREDWKSDGKSKRPDNSRVRPDSIGSRRTDRANRHRRPKG